mmetsp:Transcript_67797/g.201711  ORF Transcript_67797/g.201711 Transcript_67797/m.201711 type:complete len:230 (+) Transcript_67797:585-1274(+)
MRASLGSTSRSFMSFASASAFASSISGLAVTSTAAEAGAAPAASALPAAPPTPTELALLLSLRERLRRRRARFLDFDRLRPFFLLLLSLRDELLLLLLEEAPLLLRFALLERLALHPPLCKSMSRMAREPACGDKVRLPVGTPGSARGGCARRSSPSLVQVLAFLASRLLLPLPYPPPLFAPWKALTSPTGRIFLAWSFPSGKRCTSKVTLSPAMSEVCSCGCTLSFEK